MKRKPKEEWTNCIKPRFIRTVTLSVFPPKRALDLSSCVEKNRMAIRQAAAMVVGLNSNADISSVYFPSQELWKDLSVLCLPLASWFQKTSLLFFHSTQILTAKTP